MKKKIAPKTQTEAPSEIDIVREGLLLGHLVKYNLYLLAKSIVFTSVVKQIGDLDKAAAETNRIIGELDLDTKKRTEQA